MTVGRCRFRLIELGRRDEVCPWEEMKVDLRGRIRSEAGQWRALVALRGRLLSRDSGMGRGGVGERVRNGWLVEGREWVSSVRQAPTPWGTLSFQVGRKASRSRSLQTRATLGARLHPLRRTLRPRGPPSSSPQPCQGSPLSCSSVRNPPQPANTRETRSNLPGGGSPEWATVERERSSAPIARLIKRRQSCLTH